MRSKAPAGDDGSNRAATATSLSMLTGIGGGMVRDVLVREIPTALRTKPAPPMLGAYLSTVAVVVTHNMS